MSLVKNIEFLRHLPKLAGKYAAGNLAERFGQEPLGPLVEVTDFGSNPGNLRMLAYAPASLAQRPALVVVLHGCVQTAPGYNSGTGWSTLAERFGFALLMPEQRSSNNANGCFNWFNPEDTARGGGEACSIRQMIARMVADYKVDQRRIFVTGLSAGGAMTSVMLATYPEIFAGGAVIAGLPFGTATNVREALNGMSTSPARPAGEWGDMVRQASKHKGPWPKISVWHGSADRTVNPANADEIVKQWLDVHGLPPEPMAEDIVDGYPRQIWWNADGETAIESYSITDMAHGTPLGTADDEEQYGVQGAFLIDAGISSSYHIASFFGLTAAIHRPAARAKPVAETQTANAQTANTETATIVRPAATAPARRPEVVDAFRPIVTPGRKSEPPPPPRRGGIDVTAVITRALTAAGLLK